MDIKIKRLLRDLSNSDDDLRALAAMTLMKLDFPAKEVREVVLGNLVEATRDQNVSVRFFSRKAINKIKKTEQLLKANMGEIPEAKLEERLKSEYYEDRLSAVMDIKANKKAEYKDIFIAMLDTEEHAFVKASLISSLKLFIDKSQASLLSRFLSDPDNRVRSNTIEALEEIKAEEAIPALFSALSDPDNRIRAVAAKALQSFGEEKVFTELKKMLESVEEWMKGSAIYALSHINASEAIKMLIETAKTSSHTETKVKAIIALANYYDSTTWTFLKGLSVNGEEPFKEIAKKALKLVEEKYGYGSPTDTIVTISEEEKEEKTSGKITTETSAGDITNAVTKLFRQGKEEAISLSSKAAINFSVTDLNKQINEIYKETGIVAFDIYQSGGIELPDLLTMGHEILRMNFFIQKYSEQKEEIKPVGFFEQLKKIFSGSTTSQKALNPQAKQFIKRRDELFLKMGKSAINKYDKEEFQPKVLEQYHISWKKMQKKLKEHKSDSDNDSK